ncbi:MAG: DUF4397 domain-containing protein [Sphingobacteriales bacterium]
MMKKHENTSKKLAKGIGLIGLFSILLTSCLKENKSPGSTAPLALLSFIQASPDQQPLDFYLNNNKVNADPVYYGNNINYVSAYAGTRIANFYTTGTTNNILSGTITLNPNTAYSLFLANKPTSPEIVLLTDTLNAPAAGFASVRFINLCPDAPAPVSLDIQGLQTLATNVPYKSYTTFIPLNGKKSYTFEARQGTTNTILATLPNVTLAAGSVYTIWFGGLGASTNNTDKLSLNLVNNAYF